MKEIDASYVRGYQEALAEFHVIWIAEGQAAAMKFLKNNMAIR